MLYLLTNTSAQLLFLQLQEGELLLSNTYTDYLLELTNEQTLEKLYCIPQIAVTNERYTSILISTDANNPLNSSLLIEYPARYSFKVYGQNSSTNLDPTNAVVVGMIEKGYLMVQDFSTPYFTDPNLSVNSDITYNG